MWTNLQQQKRNLEKNFSKELGVASVISFIKGQKIQWFGHVMRKREDDISRAV